MCIDVLVNEMVRRKAPTMHLGWPHGINPSHRPTDRHPARRADPVDVEKALVATVVDWFAGDYL